MNNSFSPLASSAQLSDTYRPIGELVADRAMLGPMQSARIERLKASIKEFGFTNPSSLIQKAVSARARR